MNDYGECMHLDCVRDARHLLGWLGYNARYMESDNMLCEEG